MRQTTQAPSHLLRYEAALPSTLEETVVRLSPYARQTLWAFWDAADRNRQVYRWIWRLYYPLCVETGILLGLGITAAIKHFGF